jgi:hypothetical protein
MAAGAGIAALGAAGFPGSPPPPKYRMKPCPVSHRIIELMNCITYVNALFYNISSLFFLEVHE